MSISGDLASVCEWLKSKGYSEESLSCLNGMSEIERLQSRIAELGKELGALRASGDNGSSIYKAIERVLDENSAWIARPNHEVTKAIALAAGVAWMNEIPRSLDEAMSTIDEISKERDALSKSLSDTVAAYEKDMAESEKERDEFAVLYAMMKLANEKAEPESDALQSTVRHDWRVQPSSIGWLYSNPDTGVEFSKQHPVDSGEVTDAENIRSATAEALKDELFMAWESLAERQSDLSLDWSAQAEKLAEALDNATYRARMNDSDGTQVSVDNYHLKNGRAVLSEYERTKGA